MEALFGLRCTRARIPCYRYIAASPFQSKVDILSAHRNRRPGCASSSTYMRRGRNASLGTHQQSLVCASCLCTDPLHSQLAPTRMSNKACSIPRHDLRYRRPHWWRHDAEHDFLIRKESFSDMVSFLDDNPSAFTFADAPPLFNQWDI